MAIVWSMGPYSCRLCRMCFAYADCGFLYLIYRYVPGNGALGLGQFGLHMPVCRYCRSVCIFHLCCSMVCYYQYLVS